MLRAVSILSAAAVLTMTLASCSTMPPPDKSERTPRWGSAIVTGGSVRGGGAGGD